MLVAVASVGLIAPTTAQASDIFNIEGMNSYVRKKSTSRKQKLFNSSSFNNEIAEQKIKSPIVENKPFEAGSFSETSTLDGKVIFTLAGLKSKHSELTEGTMATYMWQGNLNTSFTGDDNLYVRLKSGNATGWLKSYPFGTYLSSSKGNSDLLKVDKIWYSFPVAERHTVWIGPKIENYYMHGTTPSIYKPVTKQFTLGGNGAAFGASTNPGLGWAYKGDNGLAISSNAVSKNGDGTAGWGTSESPTSWATQIGMTKPNYSYSLIFNRKTNGWADSYYTTPLGKVRPDGGDSDNFGLRGWWRPEDSGTSIPSISVGYDYSTVSGQTQDTSAYFLGLTWQDIFSPDDRIGFAVGQPQTRDDETIDPLSWEAYYTYQVNDSVTVTPAVFGGSERNGTANGDLTGAVVETTFKF